MNDKEDIISELTKRLRKRYIVGVARICEELLHMCNPGGLIQPLQFYNMNTDVFDSTKCINKIRIYLMSLDIYKGYDFNKLDKIHIGVYRNQRGKFSYTDPLEAAISKVCNGTEKKELRKRIDKNCRVDAVYSTVSPTRSTLVTVVGEDKNRVELVKPRGWFYVEDIYSPIYYKSWNYEDCVQYIIRNDSDICDNVYTTELDEYKDLLDYVCRDIPDYTYHIGATIIQTDDIGEISRYWISGGIHENKRQ